MQAAILGSLPKNWFPHRSVAPPRGLTLIRWGLRTSGHFKMSNMKTVSLIAAQIQHETRERHLGFAALIKLFDDEVEKLNNKIKRLEERVDILDYLSKKVSKSND